MFFGRRRPSTPSDTDPAAAAPGSRSDALRPVAIEDHPRIRRPRGGLLSMLSGALTIGTAVVGVVVFALVSLNHEVDEPGPLATEKVVFIPKNTGTGEIAEILTKEGVIDNASLFEGYAYLKRSKGHLKAGEYLFKPGTSIGDAIDTLINGKAILHSLTVPEGLTSEQIVARVRDNDVLTGDIAEIPREGSLLPDTYKFERGQTRQGLITQMQKEQRDLLAKVWARRSPDLPIKTPQELVILASIVEKETGKADERPRVASVFLNRLQRRIKLQSDPTIVYGIVGGKGTLGRGITRSEIDKPTPYNTYAIEGLPPTPIANPGRAALEATANPLKTKELYFVADGTGGHAFSESLDQHQRAVVRYRQIERARAAAGAAEPQADRAEPAAGSDTRSDFEADTPASQAVRSASTGRAFDASEGTARDPLANRGWDLTSAKTVPNLGGGPEVAHPPAARARSADRRAAKRKQPPAPEELPPPPGVSLR